MKRDILISLFLFFFSVAGCTRCVFGQGTFMNLDFESPILPLVRDEYFRVPAARAIPYWKVYINAAEVDWVVYNTTTLSAPAVSFYGPGSPDQSAHSGVYSVRLAAGLFPTDPTHVVNTAIGQTGQVPEDAKSLIFHSYNFFDGVQVSFAGEVLPVIDLPPDESYEKFGVDISRFAGMTGELRFTGLGSGPFDDIRFSTETIPEPRTFFLVLTGAALFWFVQLRLIR